MAWTLKAKWPVAKRDEIVNAHFEDIRKLCWALRFGRYYRTRGVEWGDEFDPLLTYYHGSACMYLGYYYWFCPNNENTTTTQSPANESNWRRIARASVYSDYWPSNACNVAAWKLLDGDTKAGVWDIWPAWRELPVPLNSYTQLTREAESGEHGAQPAEFDGALTNYDNRKVVEFCQFYLPDGNWAEMITGAIGTQYEHLFSPYEGTYSYFPYWAPGYSMLDSGNQIVDIKFRGMQSYVERLFEAATWMCKTDEDYKWVKDGEYASTFSIKPPIAELRHVLWFCNNSAFELGLKKLGHYDWYLDTNHPWYLSYDHKQYVGRWGCWRRMWRYSHGYPAAATNKYASGTDPVVLVWPGELGTPPGADETFSSYNETDDIVDYWSDSDNYAVQMTAIKNAWASNPEAFEDMDKRHLPLFIEHIKSDNVTPPAAYASREKEINDEDWWYKAIFELNHNILNDVKEMLEMLNLHQEDMSGLFRFVQMWSWMVDGIDDYSYEGEITKASTDKNAALAEAVAGASFNTDPWTGVELFPGWSVNSKTTGESSSAAFGTGGLGADMWTRDSVYPYYIGQFNYRHGVWVKPNATAWAALSEDTKERLKSAKHLYMLVGVQQYGAMALNPDTTKHHYCAPWHESQDMGDLDIKIRYRHAVQGVWDRGASFPEGEIGDTGAGLQWANIGEGYDPDKHWHILPNLPSASQFNLSPADHPAPGDPAGQPGTISAGLYASLGVGDLLALEVNPFDLDLIQYTMDAPPPIVL